MVEIKEGPLELGREEADGDLPGAGREGKGSGSWEGEALRPPC